MAPSGSRTTCVEGLVARFERPPFLLARALRHNRRLLLLTFRLTFRRRKLKNFFFGMWIELYRHQFEPVVRALGVGPMDVVQWRRRWRDFFYLFFYF